MMRIHAFPGILFADRGGTARPGGAGRLAAPPYDQIDEALRDQFHRSDPYHFAHLSRPVDDNEAAAHQHAADLHEDWLASGALRRDDAPGLYPYVIRLADGGERLGLCALVGLEGSGSEIVRPHEQTVPKTVAERLALLGAMKVDLEPILLLTEDDGTLDALLREDLETAELVVSHTDPYGHEHRLFRIVDPGRIGVYRQTLAGCSSIIADGHHRYRVAQYYADETQPPPGTAAGAKLAVLTSLASPRLTIEPIHRGLKTDLDWQTVDPLIASRRLWEGENGAALGAAVAAAEQPAIAVRTASGEIEIWCLDRERAIAATGTGSPGLAVTLLHDALLPALGLPESAATDGTVVYRSDPQVLFGNLRDGELATGIWLPPMAPPEFAAAVAGGRVLPPKSTRFMPKVVSGLVWAGHDAPIT